MLNVFVLIKIHNLLQWMFM